MSRRLYARAVSVFAERKCKTRREIIHRSNRPPVSAAMKAARMSQRLVIRKKSVCAVYIF